MYHFPPIIDRYDILDIVPVWDGNEEGNIMIRDFFAGAAKNRWAAYGAILLVAVFLGYAAGRGLGSRLVERVVIGESRFPLLLAKPVGQFIDIYRLLNSDNPFSRLSGYYSLVDNRMIDEDFIIERFRAERLDVTRTTLLWILSFSRDADRVMDFYESIYSDSDVAIQAEIRRHMQRVNAVRYAEFLRTTGIKMDAAVK